MSRRTAITIAAFVTVGACGGGHDGSSTGAPSTVPAAVSTSAGGDAAPDVTTTVTSAAPAPPTSVAAAPAPVAAIPGTYRYRQAGDFRFGTDRDEVPPEGTLDVAPVAGDEQTLRRFIDPDRPGDDNVFRIDASGRYLTETIVRQVGTELRCTFDPPVALPPWPPRVGATFDGHGACGALQTEISGSITGERSVSIDGVEQTALVIVADVRTSGQVTSSGTQTDWWVPELGLSVHNETKQAGTFGAIEFAVDLVSDLVSSTPS